MSNIDIYAVLEKFKAEWGYAIPASANVIQAIIEHLRKAEQTGYLGTLYRTDFEVEGTDVFPIDMLRYTSAWPKDEIDARTIEDSYDERPWRRTVVLSKYHRDPEPQIAADRWQSKFRWRVVRVIETVVI
jgi:hypothetical protein